MIELHSTVRGWVENVAPLARALDLGVAFGSMTLGEVRVNRFLGVRS